MFFSETETGVKVNIPFSFNGYSITKEIGCGSTSIVCLVENEETFEEYAAKIIPTNGMNERNIKCIQREISILENINHPNIVKVHDVFEFQEFIVIIMDYCSNGDLLSFALDDKFKNKEDLKNILQVCFQAIEYLHENGIAHGDIKPENVLLDENNVPKLTDFGYAKTSLFAGDDMKNGTIFYAAPELFQPGEFNTQKADIWAIGIFLHAITQKSFPFKDGSQKQIIDQICYRDFHPGKNMEPNLEKLFNSCTKVNQKERPTIHEILNSAWFKDNNIDFCKAIPKQSNSSIVNSSETYIF